MTAITSSAPASVSDPAAGRASGSAPAGTRFSESRLIPNTALRYIMVAIPLTGGLVLLLHG